MALAWEHYLAPCLRGTSWPPGATIGMYTLACSSRVVPLTITNKSLLSSPALFDVNGGFKALTSEATFL